MRILVVSDMAPYPPMTGTPLRIFNLLRRVAVEHDVWLATFTRTREEAEGISSLGEFCAGVESVELPNYGALSRPSGLVRNLLSGSPPDLRLYDSPELSDVARRLTAKVEFDVVQVENSYMAFYLDRISRSARTVTVLDCIDVVYRKYERMSRLEPKPARKVRTWLHGRMMRKWEPRQAARFDCCLTMSEADRRELLVANPQIRGRVVPNGVDTERMQPLHSHDGPPALVFVGNMQYRPNADAVVAFCESVLPRVRHAMGRVEMWIVGTDPGPEVLRLDGDGVHVTGRVEDVRPYYARSTVCVVPLRAGSGTRLKILEAMALGRPVVSTPVGCEGIEARDGEHLLIAKDPDELAAKTIELLSNDQLRDRVAGSARELVVSTYDWDVIAKGLIGVYKELSDAKKARHEFELPIAGKPGAAVGIRRPTK